MKMFVGEKVQTGEWDGQPIYRTRTAEEVLINIVDQDDAARKLKVAHALQPENEIFINANSWCEYCARNYPEWMTTTVGDISLCDGCYDHFN